MGKRIFIVCFLLVAVIISKANSYKIAVHWEGIKDTTLFLAHYIDTRLYVDDSIKLDQNGKGVFQGNKQLNQGLYVLYLNEKAYVDFLLGSDQDFSIYTKEPDIYNSIKISNATESEYFIKYQYFLRKYNVEKTELSQRYQAADAEERKKIEARMKEIDLTVSAFFATETAKLPGSMYSVFLRASDQVQVPEPPVGREHPQFDSIAWFHQYNFNRDHFLDNIDFTDERIMFTPLLQPKLDTYFNRIIIQSPDSIIPQAIKLIDRSSKNEKMFQYVSQFLLNNSLQSKIMGMDAVFVSVADYVYLSGRATWADSTTLAKIAEEAYLTRYNLVGNVAPEIVMENIHGEIQSLHQVQAQYTILVFWEPNCGHCKKELPELHEKVYLKYLSNNIDIVAVTLSNKKEEWVEHVEEYNITDWHHFWDPDHKSRFRFKYNVKSTPLLYLLDKDKKIIAKKIDIANLVKLLDSLLKK
jgi:thiol-disulfide isomerase/thioredoxin